MTSTGAPLTWVDHRPQLHRLRPLSNGATTVMYEGAPRPSKPGAFWELIQKHGITIFYTAPTAIRAFMKNGREVPDQHDMSSLRLLGTVVCRSTRKLGCGTAMIAGGRCPIIDTWWQTETGGVMISPLQVQPQPSRAQQHCRCLELKLMWSMPRATAAPLMKVDTWWCVVRPGMMRTVHGNPQRFRESYWEHIRPADGSHIYFAGDGARRDQDGYLGDGSR